MTDVRVGRKHEAWRSSNGVIYHFDRWVDHQGRHYRCTTQDLVIIAEELNPQESFRAWVMDWIDRIADASS